ncbi:arylsulfatase [Microbacterium rhizomatis]|uniref:Arylsulfatase n=1 Tax=Microbacterium rhizomatis TaxID=1631477 RepID=A0A5J5J8E6_9MICO|nr:arylsulfatase [Microbacterium rhizomatis]KAA9111285.1 arylsulfatase [Microbacterium rhizomatis]
MPDHEVDRTQLPIRDVPFSGTMGRTLADSVPDWGIVADVPPPEGAPNVLLILIDDAGFGQASTFGGPIDTPNLSRLADRGLRYNAMHVAALCSPTRAALLTGRNHHAAGFGSVGELPGPFPGYSGVLPKSCTPFPKILRDNGYSTAAIGKWHLSPSRVHGPAGPFDRWPSGWGFDYFWGFLSGESGQYDPMIYENDAVDQAYGGPGDRDFYLPDALTDKSIEWLHGITAHKQEKPWFMYYSTGCAHAPHHVPEEWSNKYRGRFDEGWDAAREAIFARQKSLGVIPADTELTPRDDAFPAWDSLTDDERALYARQMEVYAGYQENADHNIGRLIDEIERMGQLDNTLILYIWGDNGASLEGTLTGSFNELTMQNGIPLTSEQQLALIDAHGGLDSWGGPDTAPHCSAAWAWAGNTPFRWGKQVASHLGGTRNPMVVSWPAAITDHGGLRSQFGHVNDIGPTILEIAGIPEPLTVDGIVQTPMAGTSLAYSFHDADAPEQHTRQYFEIYGNRGMYQDGWWAACMLPRIPWDATPATIRRFAPDVFDPDALEWELYYLPDDFSQARNVAAEHPEKVRELEALWWEEAARNNALPMLAGMSAFFGVVPPLREQTRWTYWGADVQNSPAGIMPPILNRSYSITAHVTVPPEGADGVLLAAFDHLGGFSLFAQNGLLRHTYSFMGVETYRQVSGVPIPSGAVAIRLDFDADAAVMAPPGEVTLWIDGEVVGRGRMDRTVPIMFNGYSGMDIGRDNGEVVDRAYQHLAPFAWNGSIERIDVDVRPPGRAANEGLHRAETAGRHARHIES